MLKAQGDLPITLEQINAATETEFVAALGGLVEHSPWVAQQVWGLRPFASVRSLHACMVDALHRAQREQQLALVRLHPELAGREAGDGTLTPSSNAEQARLGLLSLSGEAHRRLNALNTAYRAKFGFPFVAALRLHDSLDSVLASLERRLQCGADAELAENLQQIGEVLRGRLARRFATPMGWLSTHVLDGVSGRPASGMNFDIARQDGDSWVVIGRGVTNDQGRTDQPVLVDALLQRGVYQFHFDVGRFYRERGVALDEVPFLDRVPLRFGIDDPDLHYHVPLLCTPWTYSTYRGS